FARHGVDALVPDEADQALVSQIIYEQVKAGRPVDIETFRAVAGRLVERGAQVIVLGCTEPSGVRGDHDLLAGPPYLGSADPRARALTVLAGAPDTARTCQPSSLVPEYRCSTGTWSSSRARDAQSVWNVSSTACGYVTTTTSRTPPAATAVRSAGSGSSSTTAPSASRPAARSSATLRSSCSLASALAAVGEGSRPRTSSHACLSSPTLRWSMIPEMTLRSVSAGTSTR